MNAREVRTITRKKQAEDKKKFEAEYKENQAKLRERIESTWSKLSPALIEKIDAIILKFAKQGYTYTMEPTSINPGGDEIIYLEGVEENLIKHRLMKYYRERGFSVEDYQYSGMKITWSSK